MTLSGTNSKNNATLNNNTAANGNNLLTLQTESDIPFIVTKHGGQTVTYGGRDSNGPSPLYAGSNTLHPNKPSTPVYIGRYYSSAVAGNLSSSHHTFRSGK